MKRSVKRHGKLVSPALCLSAALGLAPAVFAAERTDFDLVCTGTGEHMASHDTSGSEWDPDKHKYVHRDGVQYSRDQTQATFQIEIHDGAGRIRPPRSMIPPLSSGSSDGWWPLHDLDITEDRIRGAFKFNGMNSPKISVDRHSGIMTMKGMETFEGTCTAVEPGSKRF